MSLDIDDLEKLEVRVRRIDVDSRTHAIQEIQSVLVTLLVSLREEAREQESEAARQRLYKTFDRDDER